jgi:hypothetical protein
VVEKQTREDLVSAGQEHRDAWLAERKSALPEPI